MNIRETDGAIKNGQSRETGKRDTGLRQTKQKTQLNMCWTQPYTRHKTKTNNTKNTPLYVLDTTIYKTQDEDKQYKKHTTICKQTQLLYNARLLIKLIS